MKHPTSTQARFVATQLRKAMMKFPNTKLNMRNDKVNTRFSKPFVGQMPLEVEPNLCGTVHCHGGSYALERCDLTKPTWYSDGALAMAHDLGFEYTSQLIEWAGKNPDIWGNQHGYNMFADRTIGGVGEEAFISPKRPNGAKSVCDIADHWMEVAERLEALEHESH